MSARIIALCLGAMLASCGSSKSGPDAFSISPSCMEAETHSDLTWIQANVFNPSCTFSGCHGTDSGGTTGRQNLSAGMAIASLVSQPSNLETSQTLVVPGSSATSYMMVMLGSIPGTIPPQDNGGDAIGTMPLDTGGVLLCQQKRDAIARWIDAGAMDD